jgi:hypothetical protein
MNKEILLSDWKMKIPNKERVDTKWKR